MLYSCTKATLQRMLKRYGIPNGEGNFFTATDQIIPRALRFSLTQKSRYTQKTLELTKTEDIFKR